MRSFLYSLLSRTLSARRRRRRRRRRSPNPKILPADGYSLKPAPPPSAGAVVIKPLGNLLLLPPDLRSSNPRDAGLGSFRALPDALFLDNVLSLLPAGSLAALSCVSRAFLALSSHDPLWKPLVLSRFAGRFEFASSWRSTFVRSLPGPPPLAACIGTTEFYSDYLFQSWLCANMEMRPEWLVRDTISRRRGITVEEFVEQFEKPNRPVLLEGCLDSWPAFRNWNRREYLLAKCGSAEFAVGPVKMTLERYLRYADNVCEERPLYLFDPRFVEKVPRLGRDYEVPVYFREDLFSVLGKERPDYRWMIIGPAGSGSSFHVDPNSTSAWNAVITGSKKWVMFPPEVVPPGVHPSADGAEVACPVSIMEWFMNFYAACNTWKRKPVECVCRAGEVVFVPNGWWHLVINLEESIAITQNYVSRSNLLNVLDFLKRPNANELVSGTKDRANLYRKFRAALDAAHPQMISRLEMEAEEKAAAARKAASFWESAIDANTGGFRFCF